LGRCTRLSQQRFDQIKDHYSRRKIQLLAFQAGKENLGRLSLGLGRLRKYSRSEWLLLAPGSTARRPKLLVRVQSVCNAWLVDATLVSFQGNANMQLSCPPKNCMLLCAGEAIGTSGNPWLIWWACRCRRLPVPFAAWRPPTLFSRAACLGYAARWSPCSQALPWLADSASPP